MNKNNVLILVSFLFSSLAFAVPHRWAAEVSRLAAEEVNAFQGETVEFYPEITAYGEPFICDSYQLFYQTNGMGGLFFSGDASTNLPVCFTPAMDVGATSYSFFIGATNSAGILFRPHGTLRMKKSPGFRPNTIPLPVQRIDFAATAYTNAPWLLTESDPGIPSAVSNAVAQAGTNAQAIANAAQSNAVSFAATNLTTRLFNPANVSEYIDGAGNKCVISNFWSMSFSADFADQYGLKPSQSNYVFTAKEQSFYESLGGFPAQYWSMSWTYQFGFRVYRNITGIYWNEWLSTTNAFILDYASMGGGTGYAIITSWSTTNLAATLASQAEVVSATAGLVSTNETRHVRLNTLTVTNKITAADGTTVIIPRTRTLIDSSSVVAADWQNRYLYNSNARLTLDWDGGILTAYHPVYGYSQSLDWINRVLMDSDEHTSMAWGDRNLQFPTAGIAVDWSVDNVVTLNGSVSIPGAALAGMELHRDSFTNIIWRSVYSNGWMWLVAYTNFPAQ